ncbi:nucleolar protein,Nop52-domain-containing protein [Microdochium trichocladiopsis]|uniref:Nucleolar protein,Nop52-domain-containing protein n=1 Tax=Microdochium trichocladiopsis TaxID=1682393 RepID=A0A9P8YGS4_9PEZI|nr:nucleolar protein,Nop52-domain-containing protein [Microdochium trichocladiopsis]KAH7039648.1 nucleolar protein,Nop52-domain-containing protein [Microdochium trichocladiopsis]
MAADTQSMPFIKHLASSDRKIRTSALETLRTFLSASASTARLSHTDNLKLWKGLYYSLWMCDRPVPQQNLCAELAGLVDVIASAARRADVSGAAGNNSGGDKEESSVEVKVVIGWLAAFWETIAREWTSIDVLRLEKFLLLVRRMFAASLVWATTASSAGAKAKAAKKNKTQKKKKEAAATNTKRKTKASQQDEEAEDDITDSDSASRTRQAALVGLFREWAFEQSGDLAKVPVGLRLHVLDLWVDEAEKAGLVVAAAVSEEAEAEEESSSTEEPKTSYLLDALRELVDAQHKSPSKPVRARAKESLADERLPWNQGGEDEEDDEEMGEGGAADEEDGWGGFDD